MVLELALACYRPTLSKKLITTLEKHKSMERVLGISNHRYAKAWALKIGWFGLTHLITCTGIFGRISGWICPHYSLFPIPLYWCLHFTLHSTSRLHCSTVKFSVSTRRSESVLPTFWKSALAAVARSSASQIQWLPWLLWERSVQNNSKMLHMDLIEPVHVSEFCRPQWNCVCRLPGRRARAGQQPVRQWSSVSHLHN